MDVVERNRLRARNGQRDRHSEEIRVVAGHRRGLLSLSSSGACGQTPLHHHGHSTTRYRQSPAEGSDNTWTAPPWVPPYPGSHERTVRGLEVGADRCSGCDARSRARTSPWRHRTAIAGEPGPSDPSLVSHTRGSSALDRRHRASTSRLSTPHTRNHGSQTKACHASAP